MTAKRDKEYAAKNQTTDGNNKQIIYKEINKN